MKFSKEFLTHLLSKVDIVTLIEEYLPLKRSGREFLSCCPFHEERTPSFTVSPQKQFFHCFGCQSHGNAIDFLMKIDRLNFVEAVEKLCGLAGILLPVESEEKRSWIASGKNKSVLGSPSASAVASAQEQEQVIFEKIVDFYHQQLFSPAAQEVLKQLVQQRKLSEEAVRSEKIGFVIPGALLKHYPQLDPKLLQRWGLFSQKGSDNDLRKEREMFAGRILFPIQNEKGKLSGFGARALGEVKPKYLNSKETPYFKKREILYHWPQAIAHHATGLKLGLKNAALLVEGYFDCLSLSSRGYEPVIAGLGTAISEWQIRKIFQRFDDLYVAYDGDLAGESAKFKLLERALPYLKPGKRIYFVQFPPGDDPDSLICRGPEGEKQLERAIQTALPLSKYFFQIIMSDLDLSSDEGKSALVHKARPLIEKIADHAFQSQLFARLSFYVGVPVLSGWEKRKEKRMRGDIAPSSEDSISFGPAALRRLVALLLQNPKLALSVDIDLASLKELAAESENIQLFLALFRQSKRQYNLLLAQRLEVWRDTPYYTLLSQLSFWNHLIDPTNEEDVFKSSLARLLEQTLEKEIDKLLLKSKNFGLNLDEKKLYLKLLSHLKKNN